MTKDAINNIGARDRDSHSGQEIHPDKLEILTSEDFAIEVAFLPTGELFRTQIELDQPDIFKTKRMQIYRLQTCLDLGIEGDVQESLREFRECLPLVFDTRVSLLVLFRNQRRKIEEMLEEEPNREDLVEASKKINQVLYLLDTGEEEEPDREDLVEAHEGIEQVLYPLDPGENVRAERSIIPVDSRSIQHTDKGAGEPLVPMTLRSISLPEYIAPEREHALDVAISDLVANLWPDASEREREQKLEIVRFVILQYHLLHATLEGEGSKSLLERQCPTISEYVTNMSKSGVTNSHPNEYLSKHHLTPLAEQVYQAKRLIPPVSFDFNRRGRNSDRTITSERSESGISLLVAQLLANSFCRERTVTQRLESPIIDLSTTVILWFLRSTTDLFNYRNEQLTESQKHILEVRHSVLENLGVSEGDYVDEVLLEKTNRGEKLESIQAILDIIKSDTGRSCTQTAKELKVSPSVLTDVIGISDAAKTTPKQMTTVEVELILLQYFVGIHNPVRELVRSLIDMYEGDIEEEITRDEWAPHYRIIKARYPRLQHIAHFLCSYNAETYRRTLLAMRDALNLE